MKLYQDGNRKNFWNKKWKDLPKKAQKNYILFIEKFIDTNISIISTGP